MTEIKRIMATNGSKIVEKCWEKHGMYAAAEILKTSPYVIRYMAQKYKWKRSIDKVPHLKQAILSGSVKKGLYRNLIFEEDENG